LLVRKVKNTLDGSNIQGKGAETMNTSANIATSIITQSGAAFNPVQFDNIPNELASEHTWVLWKLAPGHKVPYHPSGKQTSPNADGSTFEAVKAAYLAGGYDGIGIIVPPDWTCIDIDDCVKRFDYVDSPIIDDWADAITMDVGGYWEYSPSGAGLHGWIHTGIPSSKRKGKIELYTHPGHFISVTGNAYEYFEDNTSGLYKLFDRIASTPVKSSYASNPTGRYRTDDQVIAAMRKAPRATAWDVFNGKINGHTSQSEAELALAGYIWYFGNKQEPAQIARLLRRSGLYRDKMDREDYMRWTVERVIQP
jgi:putative DNA primase/helicase